jgi:hypothetical protein
MCRKEKQQCYIYIQNCNINLSCRTLNGQEQRETLISNATKQLAKQIHHHLKMCPEKWTQYTGDRSFHIIQFNNVLSMLRQHFTHTSVNLPCRQTYNCFYFLLTAAGKVTAVTIILVMWFSCENWLWGKYLLTFIYTPLHCGASGGGGVLRTEPRYIYRQPTEIRVSECVQSCACAQKVWSSVIRLRFATQFSLSTLLFIYWKVNIITVTVIIKLNSLHYVLGHAVS